MRRFLLVLLLTGCSSAGGVDPNQGLPAGAAGKAQGGTGGEGVAGEDQGSSGSSGQAGAGGSLAGAGGASAGAGGDAGGGGDAGAGGSDAGAGGTAGASGSGDAGSAGNGGSAGMAGDGGSAGEGGAAGSGGGGTAGNGGDPFGGGGAGQAGAGNGGAAGVNDCGEEASGPPEVYAHSAQTLYRVDAETKQVTTVGSTKCGDSVIDIAINKEGNIYGTTFGSLVTLDKVTAACKVIKDGSYPNSLSFVPAGTIFPDKEALVGYFGSQYVLIDPDSGAISNKGTLGGGYSSSGDIVSVIGGGTYLTVNGNGCGDCIVQVDPSTGALIQNLGSINYPAVYGLAFWAGELYGFTSAGKIFVYDLATKQSTEVAIPNKPSSLSFNGAGSTTCARLLKP
jgi:hypothetical protein